MRGWWNLVDTRDLKSLGFTAVRVQVPLCAPEIITPANCRGFDIEGIMSERV